MGGNKNGIQARIKRDSGIEKTTAANTDRNTAPGTAARGHRSATEQETRPKTYTDTHTTATPRQSAKKRAPAHKRSRSASEFAVCGVQSSASGCGMIRFRQLATIETSFSRGIIGISI